MKKIYILTAITAQGFGGQEKYKEVVTVEGGEEVLRIAKQAFAIKYGVDLRLVQASLFSL